MTPAEALGRGLAELGLDPPSDGIRKLSLFIALLAKWNRTHNLTAIRDPHDMVSHHLLDSLAVLPHLPPGRLADVGSGGGLPGIPIAILQPERGVTLNDSNHKKGAFLRQAVIELDLKAAVHIGRVEDWAPMPRFACIITRGFAALAEFVAACRHLIEPGGVLAAMKGLYPEAEIAGLPRGIEVDRVVRLDVPRLDAARHLVLCRVVGAP